MSGLGSKKYLLVGVLVLATYLITESRGMVFSSADTKQTIPVGARSQKGYRTHGFWFVGYHGGK